MKQYTALLALMILTIYGVRSQSPDKGFTPTIGDTLPNYTFKDLLNYDSETLKISDLRGKWVVMDFWHKSCTGCLKSFPKMNALHEKFKDNVVILMVGTVASYKKGNGEVVDREHETKVLYERLEKLYDLKFPVAFDDSLESIYGLGYFPYILVLDPEGQVRAITTSIDESSILSFLSGNDPTLNRGYTSNEMRILKEGYSKSKPDSLFENIGNSFDYQLLRSELSLYNRQTMPPDYLIDFHDPHNNRTRRALDQGILRVADVSLRELFNVAFFGVTDWASTHPNYYVRSKDLIFETTDTMKFNNINRYVYSLTMPHNNADVNTFQLILQKDLEVYTGLRGNLEQRQMPVFFLTITDPKKAKKLSSKGKSDRYVYNTNEPIRLQLILNNVSVKTLCERMGNTANIKQPVIDNTSISSNIDINLRGAVYDLQGLNKALADYGLNLQEGRKEMVAIVVRDSEKY